MPDITVAITTYNLQEYIHGCFKDLQNQTFQNFEILVYDDCSSDKTREILLSYKTQLCSKLKVIFGETPQKLPGKSRNMILKSGMICGKYVVFLDGDDNIEADFLERLYTAAETHDADIAFCAYDRFEDTTGHILCQEMRGYSSLLELGKNSCPSIAFINTALWNKLIRTDRLQGIFMPEFSVGEDASFLMSVYTRCQKIACVDQILIHYRVRTSSVISNTPENSVYDFAEELYRLWSTTSDVWLKDHIALATFIHIGLSMPLRVYDNPNIDTNRVLHWVYNYFAKDFHWFHGNPYFNLSYLLQQKIKGIGIYTALVFHRIHSFKFFLWIYTAMTRLLKIDIKF